MFGLSFGEIAVVVLVGIVLLGPKRLPEMMRTAGQWITKLRRMSGDLRAQSGIDDLIRQEGLEKEIQEIRSLSRINVIDTLMAPAAAAGTAAAQRATVNTPKVEPKYTAPKPQPLREREYPVHGCDAHGALPDDVAPKAAPPAAIVEPAADPVVAAVVEPVELPVPAAASPSTEAV